MYVEVTTALPPGLLHTLAASAQGQALKATLGVGGLGSAVPHHSSTHHISDCCEDPSSIPWALFRRKDQASQQF